MVGDLLGMKVGAPPNRKSSRDALLEGYEIGRIAAQHKRMNFMSIMEFVERSTLSRATVYNMMDRGELPRAKRLTARRVGWPREEIEAWFKSREDA